MLLVVFGRTGVPQGLRVFMVFKQPRILSLRERLSEIETINIVIKFMNN